MTKFGQVIAYNNETGIATIRYARPEACEHCGACGQGGREETIDLPAQCQEGNWVRVELPDNRFLSATFMAYVIPLIFFVVGLLLGNSLSGGNELWAMGGSLIGLGLGVAGMKVCDKVISGKPEWTPHVAQVYEQKPDIGVLGCGQE